MRHSDANPGEALASLPEATMFEGSANRWRTFDAWPPNAALERALYFRQASGLSFEAPATGTTKRAKHLVPTR